MKITWVTIGAAVLLAACAAPLPPPVPVPPPPVPLVAPFPPPLPAPPEAQLPAPRQYTRKYRHYRRVKHDISHRRHMPPHPISSGRPSSQPPGPPQPLTK